MKFGTQHLMAALAAGAIAGATSAQVVTHDVFYSLYGTFNAPNVKRVTVSYDRSAHVATLTDITPIAQVPDADGITFAADGDLLIGGRFSGDVFKVNRTTGSFTGQPTGLPQSYHVKLDPNGMQCWTSEEPSAVSILPLSPFAPGTVHNVTGDETGITDLAWKPGQSNIAYYTSSTGDGHGSFGVIDLTTFVTTRVLSNADYAHGIQYDPFTGNLILFGEHKIGQVDPSTNPPTLVSVADFSSQWPFLDLDQGAVDGTGIIYCASNHGELLVMDYAGTHQVGTSMATASIPYLDGNLDDIAPVIGPGVAPCCPIGSGAFDFRDAQQSQLPGISPVPFDFRVADDFYLLPDRIYNIHSIEGTMITDDILLPKAQLEIYSDCNGLPADPPFRVVAQASSITDTGATFQGKHVLTVTFDFTDLWLRGGENYWVSFIGKGLASPDEVWYWGTAGNGVGHDIKGRPGAFKSVIAGIPQWVPIDGQGCPTCIGCTDFAFCVHADSCKILDDNGHYFPGGTISLDGPGGTAARSADDFVVPPCLNDQVCYIEAYIASNCDQARVAIYNNACTSSDHIEHTVGGNTPDGFSPIATLTPDNVVNTGQFLTVGNQSLPILCLQFWTMNLTLAPGDYWLSAYGLSTGNAAQQAYFLFNQDCRRSCLIRWSEGAIYGPAVQPAPSHWVYGSSLPGGSAHDYAFMVAVMDPVAASGLPGDGSAACAADFNGSGTLNAQDIFDFLSAWFAGCP